MKGTYNNPLEQEVTFVNQNPFGGQPVIHFANDKDRRAFLKYAALVGSAHSGAVTHGRRR